MKLTKRQIAKIISAHKKALAAENAFHGAMGSLAEVIIDATGVDGNVDFLPGDGFGFTPLSNNFVHIGISELVYLASEGEDITEELILENLTF